MKKNVKIRSDGLLSIIIQLSQTLQCPGKLSSSKYSLPYCQDMFFFFYYLESFIFLPLFRKKGGKVEYNPFAAKKQYFVLSVYFSITFFIEQILTLIIL